MRNKSLLIWILLGILLIPKSALSANSVPQLLVSFDQVSYEEGDVAYLTVSLENFSDLYGFQADIQFDPNYLIPDNSVSPFQFNETYFNPIADEVFLNQYQNGLSSTVVSRRLNYSDGYTSVNQERLFQIPLKVMQTITTSSQFINVSNELDDLKFAEATIVLKLSDSKGEAINYALKETNIPPVINVRDAINVEAGTTLNDLMESFDITSIYGNDIEITLIGTPSLKLDEIGDYEVTIKATDTYGNISQKTVSMTVLDTTPPSFDVKDQSLPKGVFSTYDWTEFIINKSDNAKGLLEAEIIEDNVLFDTLGAYTVTVALVDASSNRSEKTFNVNIVEDPPTLSLVGDRFMTIDVFSDFSDPYVSVDDDNAVITVSGSVDTSKLGTYTLSYDATNEFGFKAATIYREVTVVDQEAPTISLRGDEIIESTVNFTYRDPGLNVSDNYDSDIEIITTGVLDTTELGTYTLSYQAVDQSGNRSEVVTRTIKVIDDIKPVITLNGDAVLKWQKGETFIDPLAQVSDNYDENLLVSVTGTVDPNQFGTYLLTYEAKDRSDNEAVTVERTVIVVDFTLLALRLVGEEKITLEYGESYQELGATIDVDPSYPNDAEDLSIEIDSNLDLSKPGSYTITYLLSEENYEARPIQRTVEVVDTVAPEITLNGEANLIVEVGDDFIDPGVTINENTLENIIPTITSDVNTQILGTYTVSYQAIDASNNASIVISRKVEVVDMTAPNISIDQSLEVEVDLNSFFEFATITALDNYDDEITEEIESTLDLSQPGAYEIIYQVSDQSGNENRLVQVVYVQRPDALSVFLNPGIDTLTTEETHLDAGVSVNDADDLSFDIEVDSTLDSTRPGTYQIRYTITNEANQSVTITRYVHILRHYTPVDFSFENTLTTLPTGSEFMIPLCEYTTQNSTFSCDTPQGDLDSSTSGSYLLAYTVENGNLKQVFHLTVTFYLDSEIEAIIAWKEKPYEMV